MIRPERESQIAEKPRKFDYLAGRDWLSPLNRLPVVHGRLSTQDPAQSARDCDAHLI
jgi:hypothetical protein